MRCVQHWRYPARRRVSEPSVHLICPQHAAAIARSFHARSSRLWDYKAVEIWGLLVIHRVRHSKATTNLYKCPQKRDDVGVFQFAEQGAEQKTLQTDCALGALQVNERNQ